MKKTTSASVIRYINDTTAQVTKAFEKKACIFGTEEFKLWREYKKEFPEAKMVTKTIKKNEDQKRRRNKTFENMEAYIATQPNAEDLKKEFETIKQRSRSRSPLTSTFCPGLRQSLMVTTTWISSWLKRKPSVRRRKQKRQRKRLLPKLPTQKITTNQPAKSERR